MTAASPRLARCLLALLAAPGATAGDGETLEAGPLRLEVHVSRTAHLFHVVDQISEWSPFCHGQYLRALEPLSAEDRALLAEHRSVRARRGWGQGLEQTFYTPLDLEDALAAGLELGHLDPRDAEVEALVLEHFAPRVEALMASDRPHLDAFRVRLRAEREALEVLARKLARLVGEAPPPVPVYLIANPAARDFGGGFNGGRLTLEVPREADALGTFLHEVFHAFLDLRRADVVRVLEGVDGRLDYQTLNEGLAHAVSPGLRHAAGQGDPLAERVRAALRRGEGLDDYGYRVHRYALALRPLVREALDDEGLTFAALLPRAIDVWHAVAELELAREER